MRTLLVASLLLAACVVLAGCSGNKVAVINSTRIYQESNAGQAGLAYLEQVEQEVRAKAEAAQRIAESTPDNEAMPMNLQRFFLACQDAMNEAQQQAVNTVQGLISSSIETYRSSNKLALIIADDSVVSADPALDVTDAVIAEMNKTPLTFAPVSIPDFEAPTAP